MGVKTKLICTAILVLAAASFNAAANPTSDCIDRLASEPSLQVLADKVALARSTQARLIKVANRAASERERPVIAAWQGKRQQCFEAGIAQRRAEMKAQEIAFLRSVFTFQQRLVAELHDGRLTYAEFNSRRLELVQAAGEEI
jgi:hypothetical protein